MAMLVWKWLVGGAVGTLLIWITSPLFVSTITVPEVHPGLGIAVYPSGMTIRWRDEGYATTRIGPLGMPGKTTLDRSAKHLLLWGDSQLEGVAVPDEDKIFAQLERRAASEASLSDIEVLPMARSGQTIRDWLAAMPAAERLLQPVAHVIVLTELGDLKPAANLSADDTAPEFRRLEEPYRRLAGVLPDFLGRAARNLIRDPVGGGTRRLRFAPGPVPAAPPYRSPDSLSVQAWKGALERIEARTDLPVVIVYAPQLPTIVGGRVIEQDENAVSFDNLQTAAAQSAIEIIDLRDELRASAHHGEWPHGFHNGRFGVGHLNRYGNAIIADGILQAIAQD